jgi:hypothetical protein
MSWESLYVHERNMRATSYTYTNYLKDEQEGAFGDVTNHA